MFENLSSAINKDEELDEPLNILTKQHLQPLKTVLKRYFFERKEQKAAFVWNPFLTALNVSDIPNELPGGRRYGPPPPPPPH